MIAFATIESPATTGDFNHPVGCANGSVGALAVDFEWRAERESCTLNAYEKCAPNGVTSLGRGGGNRG
jgi:hypothetical protein